MNIETFLMRLGIRTYSYPVITQITSKIEIQFGDSLSTELGWIYGISAEVDGVTPKDPGVPLPTLAQSAGLYINMQYGQTWYLNDYRYTNLVYYAPSTGIPINSERMLRVNIPYSTDLKQSIIRNPLAQTGFSTMITFHYIPLKTYEYMVKNNVVKEIDLGIV